METPRRKRSRSRAHEHQIAQASSMKKREKIVKGVVDVGTIIHVGL